MNPPESPSPASNSNPAPSTTNSCGVRPGSCCSPGGAPCFLRPPFLILMALVLGAPIYLMFTRPQPSGTTAAATKLPVLYALPDFSLTERSGANVTLATLKGKVWVADFIFTTCTGPCPLMTRQMADLQTALANQPDIRLLTISVDPKRDTPERLTEYATQYQADPQRWLFVTGDRQAIYDLSAKGFKLGTIVEADEVATTEHPILHSSKMALVDRDGQIRAYYDGTSPDDVARLKVDAVRLAAEGH